MGRVRQSASGTGPFKITEVKPRVSVELSRNTSYWDKNRIPKLDKMVLTPMPEATTRLAALRSGQVDWIEVPPPDAISGLKSAGFDVVTSKFPHIWPYWLKTTGDSPFKDARVRQAFNYAIDRDAVLALLNGAGEPAFGFWKKDDPRFGNPKNDYKYDPAKAKALLMEAGYKPGELVKVKAIISTSGSGQMLPLPMNEVVQQGAKAAGFDIEFVVVEWGAMLVAFRILERPAVARLRGHEHQPGLLGRVADGRAVPRLQLPAERRQLGALEERGLRRSVPAHRAIV